MPLAPSVTEVVVGQLLYMNFEKSQEPITMYINSVGTNSPDGRPWSFDTEAFAIADTMLFVKSPIRTICIGQAYGTAAMLLALGNKGQRAALPNAAVMLNQPKSRMRGQATDVAVRAKEILHNRRTTNELLAKVHHSNFG
jgi:ATP-dependent Clp protease protease subunit